MVVSYISMRMPSTKNTKSTIQGVRENAINFLMGDQYYTLVTIMHAIPEKRKIVLIGWPSK